MSTYKKSNLDGLCLHCDDHCRRRYIPRARITDEAELRKAAAQRGWTSRPIRDCKTVFVDLCPEHKGG